MAWSKYWIEDILLKIHSFFYTSLHSISKFYRTANLLFSSPLTRATPYLLGIGTGLLHRSQAGVIEIASELIPVGWLCAAVSLIWCFWSPSIGMHTDFVYAAKDAAAYAAWCPLILGLALAWCIFMFPRDENSILRFLTTLRPILFLSRITFPLQLVTYVVLLYNTAIVTEPRKYHLSDLVSIGHNLRLTAKVKTFYAHVSGQL